jgi:heme A synthase
LVVSEALIGAGLVRFEWVAGNVSEARVYVMAFHLVNTFFLLAALTLTAWLAGKPGTPELRAPAAILLACCGSLALVLVLGASGAVTALGDTLVLTAGIRPEESPLVARLVASRFHHPTLALASFVFVAVAIVWLRPRVSEPARHLGFFAIAVFAAQLAIGAVNVFLKAPVSLQLLHLAVSDVLWILLVLMTAESASAFTAPDESAGAFDT